VELRRTVLVQNRQGLHARPCHSIVSTALEFSSELRIATLAPEQEDVNGKSILELMTLQAAKGTRLELRASGEDASRLLAALEELFRSGFAED
jgi:phosphocarrier protein